MAARSANQIPRIALYNDPVFNNGYYSFYRFSRKNKIFAGLWFGTSKPDFRTFLEPFGNTLKEMFDKGTL